MLEGHFIDPADMYDRQQNKRINDFVMVYCPKCSQRVEFPIKHDKSDGSYFQAVNIPTEIALKMKWKDPIMWESCDAKLDLEAVYEKPQRVELKVKLDCSEMPKGMDSWYDEHGRGYD